ncbi:MAG: nucleotidyltransferase family protein [Candidatus Aminicenantes bacterium]|nr:nucleotidyltransferase family protein [Candidatus Aminicenantes bacterium]
MIWALVLAAGESKRMGESKQLLPFGNKTMIETVIDHIMHSEVDEILVVLGSNRENIECVLKDMPVRSVHNPRFKEGMLSSIQKGFVSLPKEAEAVLVFLGDQPMIPSSSVDQIIRAYRSSAKGIVLPVYQQRRGHPILIDVTYRQEVANLNPEIGLRELIHNHPEDILEVDLDSPSILEDIDTPEDYKNLKN